ncbi:MAG: FecR domain-containing protein [Pseudomonadota bacterium]
MPDPNREDLLREATSIFLRLRDDPDDPDFQEKRDTFVRRGQAERDAYAKVLEVWQATDTSPPKRSPPIATTAAVGLLFVGLFAYQPVALQLRSDFSTRFEPVETELASGDGIALDARSLVADNTSDRIRRVDLLKGAAFFDVISDGRPFVVAAGSVEVEVLGTSFEVARSDDGALISVSEGVVRVRQNQRSWTVEAGEALNLTEGTAGSLQQISSNGSAGWRDDLLTSDGLTFGQIADFLERRMPGRILITSNRLARTPVVGTFDLSDPSNSLELLAELTGAKITTLPFVVTTIRP